MLFTAWLASKLINFRTRHNIQPVYSKFVDRLRWEDRFFPKTRFHCVYCGCFTFRKSKHRDPPRKYNWNYQWWTFNGIYYECRGCAKRVKEGRKEYLQDNQLWKTSPDALVLKEA